jgi:hypothetical protein
MQRIRIQARPKQPHKPAPLGLHTPAGRLLPY